MGEEYTDIKHRSLSSLTPEEYQALVSLLSLVGATLERPTPEHKYTLNVPQARFRQNALRLPGDVTVGSVLDWARLLNRRSES